MGKEINLRDMIRGILQRKKKKGRDRRQPNKLKVSLMSQGFCGFLASPKRSFFTSSQPQMFFIIFGTEHERKTNKSAILKHT